jgi:hypothetical protein
MTRSLLVGIWPQERGHALARNTAIPCARENGQNRQPLRAQSWHWRVARLEGEASESQKPQHL